MEIVIAKNAGFCFGVKRAIDEAYKTLEKTSKNIYSIGPLIHNEVVTNDLKNKGLIEVNDINDILNLKNKTVLLRTHGIEKNIFESLKKNNNDIMDLTCPFVKKIHNLVRDYSKNRYKVIVIGDKNHPEVKGIVSYAENDIYVIINESDIKMLPFDRNSKILVVFQTTTSVSIGEKLVDILKELFYNITIENTICNATDTRQDEVRKLAKVSDAMFIIGSKSSSNTKKLYDIAKENCDKTYLLSNKSDLLNINIKDAKKLGVSAGASTPEYLIEEILKHVRNEF